MEMIIFQWNYEGKADNADVTVSMSSEDKKIIARNEICNSFVRFLAAAGYSTEGLSKEFKD